MKLLSKESTRSWNPTQTPDCPETSGLDAIETLIISRTRDLGGFEVRRALPAPKQQMVGSFIFFDHMGLAEFLIGGGIDVRPHPHIGLATVSPVPFVIPTVDGGDNAAVANARQAQTEIAAAIGKTLLSMRVRSARS